MRHDLHPNGHSPQATRLESKFVWVRQRSRHAWRRARTEGDALRPSRVLSHSRRRMAPPGGNGKQPQPRRGEAKTTYSVRAPGRCAAPPARSQLTPRRRFAPRSSTPISCSSPSSRRTRRASCCARIRPSTRCARAPPPTRARNACSHPLPRALRCSCCTRSTSRRGRCLNSSRSCPR